MNDKTDRSITQIIAIGALAVAILGNLGVFAYSAISNKQTKQEKIARISQVDFFLKLECQRDTVRDNILIGALRDAEARARASISDPRLQHIQITHLENTINQLEVLHNKCVSSLPVK